MFMFEIPFAVRCLVGFVRQVQNAGAATDPNNRRPAVTRRRIYQRKPTTHPEDFHYPLSGCEVTGVEGMHNDNINSAGAIIDSTKLTTVWVDISCKGG
jgi:hypothetical protein